ncbi:UNVERIFIED_CONTAM: hypothetical protein FKN15_013500 [Acipenser sinensis]
MAAQIRALVSVKWLADAVKNNRVGPNLRVLDTSWYLPKLKRQPKKEFRERHIPGASFFDIDKCSDNTSPFDHMMPGESEFGEFVGNLGIGTRTHVVVYNASELGSFSAPPRLVDVPGVRAQFGLGAGRRVEGLGPGRLPADRGVHQTRTGRVQGETGPLPGEKLPGRAGEFREQAVSTRGRETRGSVQRNRTRTA